jgi:hypothetical protein
MSQDLPNHPGLAAAPVSGAPSNLVPLGQAGEGVSKSTGNRDDAGRRAVPTYTPLLPPLAVAGASAAPPLARQRSQLRLQVSLSL